MESSKQHLDSSLSAESVLDALRESEARLAKLLELMPAAVYTCDAEGRLTFYNRRAAELWGREPTLGDPQEKYCGSFRMWTPDGLPLPHGPAVHAGCPARDLEVVIEQPGGARVIANVNIDPLRDREGRLLGAINVFVDITDRKRSETALEAELAGMTRLQELSDRLLSAPDLSAALREVLDTAIGLHAADRGTVQIYEPVRERLKAVAARGFDLSTLTKVPPIDREFHSPCAAAFRTGQPVLVSDIAADPRFAAHRATAAHFGYRAAFSFPLTTRRGDFLGVLTVHFRNPREPSERELRWAALYAPAAAHLIERQRAQEALQQSEQRLRLALKAARMGTWSRELSTDLHHRDPNLNRLFGLEPVETVVPSEQFLSHVHTNDRERVRAAFDASVRDGQNLRTDFRVVWPDGQVRWLSEQGDTFGVGDQRYLAGTCVDITERREGEEQLREAKLAAEAANNAKDEFLSVVSHELRTPLAAILFYAKMLQSGVVRGTDTAAAFDAIVKSAEAQQELIEDLLDMSRVIAGNLRLDVRDAELVSIIRTAADAVRPMAEGKRIRLETLDEAHDIAMRVDPDRIQQVLWNLLSNAVKFTEPGGRVRISTRRRNDTVELDVADTGRGIKSEFLPHVFDRFRQEDATSTRAVGGLGLGLAISRQLVELHGGTIGAFSEGEGKGATFTVTLPLIDTTSPPGDGEEPRSAGGRPLPRLAGLRLLVVEDDQAMRTALRLLLSQAGAHVTAAGSVAEALAEFQARIKANAPFEMVLSDLGMPGRHGFDLIRAIRDVEQTRRLTRVTAIALSAYAREVDRQTSVEAGFDAHVAKPIEPADLVETILRLRGPNQLSASSLS